MNFIMTHTYIFALLVLIACLYLSLVSSETLPACAIPLAEHPTLTSRSRDVALCGSQYSFEDVDLACGKDWHVCLHPEFNAHFPFGCDPRSISPTYNYTLPPSKRCDPCSDAVYRAFAPKNDSAYCGNLWNTPHTPAGTRHIVLSEDKRDYLFGEISAWDTPSSFKKGDVAEDGFSVYCCSEKGKSTSASACTVQEAEHPSLTSPGRDAALCGGKYKLEKAESACQIGWHVCLINEWTDRYPHVPNNGTLSSWGVSQKKRGLACPNLSNTWDPAAPAPDEQVDCPNTCGKASIPFADAIALYGGFVKGSNTTREVLLNDRIYPPQWISNKFENNLNHTKYQKLAVFCCLNNITTHGHVECPAKSHKGTRWVWVIVCIVSGFLVLIGLVYCGFIAVGKKKDYSHVLNEIEEAKRAKEAEEAETVEEVGLEHGDGDDETARLLSSENAVNYDPTDDDGDEFGKLRSNDPAIVGGEDVYPDVEHQGIVEPGEALDGGDHEDAPLLSLPANGAVAVDEPEPEPVTSEDAPQDPSNSE